MIAKGKAEATFEGVDCTVRFAGEARSCSEIYVLGFFRGKDENGDLAEALTSAGSLLSSHHLDSVTHLAAHVSLFISDFAVCGREIHESSHIDLSQKPDFSASDANTRRSMGLRRHGRTQTWVESVTLLDTLLLFCFCPTDAIIMDPEIRPKVVYGSMAYQGHVVFGWPYAAQ